MGAPVIDLFSAMQEREDWVALLHDGLHPGPEGGGATCVSAAASDLSGTARWAARLGEVDLGPGTCQVRGGTQAYRRGVPGPGARVAWRAALAARAAERRTRPRLAR